MKIETFSTIVIVRPDIMMMELRNVNLVITDVKPVQMVIHVILVMKLTNIELHQVACVHAKEDIMKIQSQKNVLNVTIHVKLVAHPQNVILAKIIEKVIIVLAQMELTMTVRVHLNVLNVMTNVKHVPELPIIVMNVLETESVNLNVIVHQEP